LFAEVVAELVVSVAVEVQGMHDIVGEQVWGTGIVEEPG
jgi:hypothetical protein